MVTFWLGGNCPSPVSYGHGNQIQTESVVQSTQAHTINPFTPKSDEYQISPAASPENTTWNSMENLAFHSLLWWKMIILPILTTSAIHTLCKGWESILFELGSERVKLRRHKNSFNQGPFEATIRGSCDQNFSFRSKGACDMFFSQDVQ